MPRFAALDTRFILALAGGEPDAEATIDYLHTTGFTPMITESVVEQLGELGQESANQLTRKCADYAARWMVTWNIITPSNATVNNGAAQVHAEKIIEQGLIPGASQIEAEILVEASCHNCELLVTFSDPLLNAPAAPLNLALLENDLHKVTVTIASPQIIARRLEVMNPANRNPSVTVQG
jgi:hypothetical protein